VVSAEELLERVWDEMADPFTTSVKVTISRLRRKLGDPPVIETVTQGGYRIGEPLDRRFPDGLRVVYPLLSVPAAEATRRRVSYALPPLSEWDAVERRAVPADGVTNRPT